MRRRAAVRKLFEAARWARIFEQWTWTWYNPEPGLFVAYATDGTIVCRLEGVKCDPHEFFRSLASAKR